MKEAKATANPATNDGETDTAEEAGAGAGASAANEAPTSEKTMATTTNNGTTEAAERETAIALKVLNKRRERERA